MSIVAIAGSAFTYYLPGLEDQANPGLFKAAPTIAAGDFTISVNGGAFGALDNTPTVSPAGSTQIAIVLSAAETTEAGAGGRITINCQDTAGAEWYSVGLAIPVQEADVSTYAGTDTAGTTELLTRIPDATPGEAGGLAVLDANLLVGADTIRLDGSAESVDNLVLSLGAGGLFAKLDTTLELDGAVYRFTLNALEQAPDNGLTAGETGDAVLDEVVEGAYTMRQLLRIMLAALAGKSSGGGTSTITFRDAADTKNRIAATVGGTGNRTAITLDGS